MNRSLNRANRIQELEWLYSQGAYTDVELAQRLGVNRSTIYRDRILLSTQIPFIETEGRRFRIDRQAYLSNLRVNMHEAFALYLAARRTARQTHSAQPHLASALTKLAHALCQPMTARLIESGAAIAGQDAQEERLRILETITRAWVEHRKVRIYYRGMQREHGKYYTLHPYRIEPTIWSDAVYVIGYSDVHDDITTFKIERIEQAELKLESFDLPEGLVETDLFRDAWGIWYDDKPPETIRLRFFPGEAARRLQESTWHPSQVITPCDDGGCTWEAQVAEWREMVPWVRGWGAACEVLEPEGLRRMVMEEARRMCEVYEGGEG